jgi:hypothetical protein
MNLGSESIWKHYIERFYWVLQLGLQADFLSLSAILMNSGRLFVAKLEGFRMLTPNYIQSMYRILPRNNFGSDALAQGADFEKLRKACYSLIGSVGYTLNRLGNVSIPSLIEIRKIQGFTDSPADALVKLSLI